MTRIELVEAMLIECDAWIQAAHKQGSPVPFQQSLLRSYAELTVELKELKKVDA